MITTARLVLRELRESDATAVATGAGERKVARYLTAIPSPYPVSLASRWVRMRIGWSSSGRGVTLAIATADAPDTLLGTVSLRHHPRDRRAELGYWLASHAWGNGFATEATRAVVDFGFRELGLARIYAQVFADNRRSQRVLEKLGMVTEGVKRKHVRKGRRLLDIVIYGVLRDEWAHAAR